MFKKLVAALFGVSLLAVLAVAGPAGAAAGDGTVYVVHGIPGVTVDVYVNGTNTLPNFAPGKVAGPLSLPAGSYAIKIFKAGADPASATAGDRQERRPARRRERQPRRRSRRGGKADVVHVRERRLGCPRRSGPPRGRAHRRRTRGRRARQRQRRRSRISPTATKTRPTFPRARSVRRWSRPAPPHRRSSARPMCR